MLNHFALRHHLQRKGNHSSTAFLVALHPLVVFPLKSFHSFCHTERKLKFLYSWWRGWKHRTSFYTFFSSRHRKVFSYLDKPWTQSSVCAPPLSPSYRSLGVRDARVRPQNLAGVRPFLTTVNRQPRWFVQCAHSAIVHAYLEWKTCRLRPTRVSCRVTWLQRTRAHNNNNI